jgi:hypothetical protein
MTDDPAMHGEITVLVRAYIQARHVPHRVSAATAQAARR